MLLDQHLCPHAQQPGLVWSVLKPCRLLLSRQVDYYLGREAGKFTGNSVSTFTAFIILERQWLGRWALVHGRSHNMADEWC